MPKKSEFSVEETDLSDGFFASYDGGAHVVIKQRDAAGKDVSTMRIGLTAWGQLLMFANRVNAMNLKRQYQFWDKNPDLGEFGDKVP